MQLAVPEIPWKRWMYSILAVAMVGGFFYLNVSFRVPAHGGVDQNGYLVGGRMFATQFSTKLDGKNPDTGQVDPFAFVGRMWVGADLGTERERFYPKYPIGLPLLVGACFWIGGESGGPELTYWISPVCMTLAIGATFLLIRAVAGSFAALLGMAAVAVSPVTLGLTTNPNSHAATLFCVALGMFLLIRWWQSGGAWRASLAGLLIGYAATIRYTEGLLVLPLLMVAIFRLWPLVRRRMKEGAASGGVLPHILETLLLLAWWSLPVLMLAVFNVSAMGTLTGYDPTNESLGFSWEYFTVNWYAMLQQLNHTGMTFLFPLSLAALVWMFSWNWRLALVLAAWVIPSAITYSFYYWAPDRAPDALNFVAQISYLRFFLTIVPALALCAYWLVSQIYSRAIDPDRAQSPQALSMIVAGVLTAASMAVSLRAAVPNLEGDHFVRLMLHDRATQIARAIEKARADRGKGPDKAPVVFAREEPLIHHLQFLTPYRYYGLQNFELRSLEALTKVDPDEPQGLDPNRRMALAARLEELVRRHSGADSGEGSASRGLRRVLIDEQQRIIRAALEHGRPVFFVMPGNSTDAASRVVDPRQFECRTVASWSMAQTPPRTTARPMPRRAMDQPSSRRRSERAWMQVIEVRLRPGVPTTMVGEWPGPDEPSRLKGRPDRFR